MTVDPVQFPTFLRLVPASPAILRLRSEIEAATGARFGRPARDAVIAAWGEADRRAVVGGRRIVRVTPGPLLSPYDTDRTGFSSLRIALAGRPFGGSNITAAFEARLRAARLSGRNRHPLGESTALRDAFAGSPVPVCALVDPQLARSPPRLRRFLTRVMREASGRRIVVGGPQGCRGVEPSLSDRLVILTDPLDPWRLFERAARVYVERPEAGCEAGLAGADVVGLDPGDAAGEPDPLSRLARRFGEGIHYFDPWTRDPIEPLDALERVAWLRDRFVGNDRRIVLVGISRWKRPAIDVFADGPHGAPIHTMTADDAVAMAVTHGAVVHAWATRMPEPLPRLCAEAKLPLSRVEDGFLRSVGLGASLKLGASIVVDDRGIYYDPRVESRLTQILQETTFAPAVTARARALREAIVARRLSKYNVGLPDLPADWPSDRRIVLVPGQVEDDASVRYGSPNVRTNLDLLRSARSRNPEAFLLYKPHPDVEAGFRPGRIVESQALGIADRIVAGFSIVDLLDRVDHVETMTSLTGFEALLRGRTVTTHGRPFYSGWGLSEDLALGSGRGRTLTLDELVAGTLILYARYLDPVSMKPCEPERLLDRLSAQRDAAAPSRLSVGALRHLGMRARYALLNPIVRRLRARRGVETRPDDSPR